MRFGRQTISVLVVSLLCLPVISGCGDDGGPTSPQDRLIGTWTATMLAATDRGVTLDLMDSVDSFVLTLTSGGTYTNTVTGDASGVVCSGNTNCTESGTYSATSSTITFDGSDTFDYSISINVLTMTATQEGIDFEFRFVKA